MDKKLRTRFMKAASQIQPASVLRYHDRSPRDFIEHVVTESETAKTCAYKIVEYYCFDEGLFNNFRPGLVLFLTFLNANYQDRPSEQAVRDLRAILQSHDLPAVMQWLNSHYY